MNENIRPSSDLRNKYSEVSKDCRENNIATILTVNGVGDAVLLSLEKYNMLKDELELYKKLADAEDDVRNGRIKEFKDTSKSIRKMLKNMEF